VNILLKELLPEKGRGVVALFDDQTVETAIGHMALKKASAIIVMKKGGGQPVGIFAERDVLRCHLKHPSRSFDEIRLSEAMTRRLIVAQSSDQVQDAMAMMIKADIRHLPVIKERELIGMLTISDLVEHLVGSLTAEIHYLQEYIDNLHDAGQD